MADPLLSPSRCGCIQPGPSVPSADFVADPEAVGDAASYGIYFDDNEYNYMQHLRQVGMTHDSFLVEAPVAKGKGKARARDDDGFQMKDVPGLPEDVLPSHPLDEISYTDATTNAAPTLGLQPDLDPKIREVLEALDDEAYAADDGTGTDDEDEFWNDVVHGGEIREGENDRWLEEEDEEVSSGVEDDGVEGVRQGVAELGGWDDVAKFKKAIAAQAAAVASDDEDDEEVDSEGGDTIAELRASSARRPPRAQKRGSVAGSQFSMTSSAMFRNEGLRTLDDRFDQIEKMYEESSDEDEWDGGEYDDDEVAAFAPPRADLEDIMDDFLSRFEVLGGKMKHVLEPAAGGASGVSGEMGKLDRIRRELASLDITDVAVEGEDPATTARRLEKEKILAMVERQEREDARKKKRDFPQVEFVRAKERWDCETVLSTYSNVSNHPRMLRLRDVRGPKLARIEIDRKTGFPMVDGEVVGSKPAKEEDDDEMLDDESDEDGRKFLPPVGQSVTTPPRSALTACPPPSSPSSPQRCVRRSSGQRARRPRTRRRARRRSRLSGRRAGSRRRAPRRRSATR